MRLIDADELRGWLNGFIETDNISPTYMRTLIDNRPTVKAIPIKWLQKYVTKIVPTKALNFIVDAIEEWTFEENEEKRR